MADESRKEPYSDSDALEELYASALSDINETELSDFDMGDIPLEDLLQASDNVEVPSFDAYSDAVDTSELDKLLEQENAADNAIVVEGAIDSGFNIEDVDWESMSLDDLMSDDDDDEIQLSEEISDTEEVEEIRVLNENVDEAQNEESAEEEFETMTDETEFSEDDIPGDAIAELLSNDSAEDLADGSYDEVTEEMNEVDELLELGEDEISLAEVNSDFADNEVTSENTEFDLSNLLADDDSVEFETIEDDLELFVDSDDNSDEPKSTNFKVDDNKDSKQKTYVEVNTKNINTSNVFEEPLSVLSDDGDESQIDVDDVEALLDTVKKDSKKKKKKKGQGFSKLFSNIVDDKEIEKIEKEKQAAAQAEINKQKKAELKKVNDEKKAQKKEENKLEKARKAEEKKAARDAKKRARKEAKEIRELEEETEIEGRINKAGAIIVFLIMGCMAAAMFFGTKMFSYNNSISNAKQYFENGQYEESYNELVGLELKEEDKILYEKVVTIMHVYKQLDAYEMYYKEGRYPQALDALLKGIREYEKNIAVATELDITTNMDELKNQIVHELSVEYGITEEIAREVNQITDSKVYSMRVYELAKELASDYY